MLSSKNLYVPASLFTLCSFRLPEQLKDEDSHVLATVRNIDHARELRELKAKHSSRLFTLEFDVIEFDAVKDAASRAAQLLPDGCGLDCLINNAAINLQEVTPFEEVCAGSPYLSLIIRRV